jgi:ParB family chromosome partitioning protein
MSNRSKKFTDLLPGAASSTTTEDKDDKPAAPPTTVLMHTITGNPENPRQPEDYTDDDPEFAELKDTMRQVGQLQPVAVVSHPVYVRLKPEFAGAVDGAEYVVVGGNRRLAAARQLGWTRIDIRVQDRLGDNDGMIDDAVIIENIHRKKIDPVKEAEFLARMVEKHGSQEEVGRRIGKTQMYVSHRLALLKLDPEVQSELEAGTVKPSQVRGLATKPAEEQRAKVAEIKQAKPKPKSAAPSVQNAVLKPAPEPAPEPTAGADADREPGTLQNAVLKTADPAAAVQAETIPEQQSGPAEIAGVEGKSFPYDDGVMSANLLIRKMATDEEFFKMVDVLNATKRRTRAAD